MSINELEGFKERIESTIKESGCPALSMAIVKDNEVVFAEGFGLRDVENNLTATADTLFGIGSCTKAFTAMAAAMMVEEGWLEWDTPIRKYLPTFRMYDPVVTERLTLRDILTHRSGLCRHDAAWYGSPLSREELIECIQYLEPNKDLRVLFQYNNLLYMVAGYLAGKVVNKSWEDLVRHRIFQPLNMERSRLTFHESIQDGNHALPYQMLENGIKQISFGMGEAIGPAGFIFSSVVEMAGWLRTNLNQGKFGQTQLLSEPFAREILSPQVVIPGSHDDIMQDFAFHRSYAMGWFTCSYRGYELLWHAGNADGYSATTCLVPKLGIGVVGLSNLQYSDYPWMMALEAIDRIAGLEFVDWNARMHADIEKNQQAVEEAFSKIVEADNQIGPPSHSWDAFAGTFRHPGYGSCQVKVNGDGLSFHYHGMDLSLKHCLYDIYEFHIDTAYLDVKVQFHMDNQGAITACSIPLQPGVRDIVFERVAEKS